MTLKAHRAIVAAAVAASIVGCGSASHAQSGPTARFNACIGATRPELSASGHPTANGAAEPIVDQLHGIVGNVWLYGSNTQARANAKVMTGYPVRITDGAYMVEVNPHVKTADTLAIQACAYDLPVTVSTLVATSSTPTSTAKISAPTTGLLTATPTAATPHCPPGSYPLKVPENSVPPSELTDAGACFKPPAASTAGTTTQAATVTANCPPGEVHEYDVPTAQCIKPSGPSGPTSSTGAAQATPQTETDTSAAAAPVCSGSTPYYSYGQCYATPQ